MASQRIQSQTKTISEARPYHRRETEIVGIARLGARPDITEPFGVDATPPTYCPWYNPYALHFSTNMIYIIVVVSFHSMLIFSFYSRISTYHPTRVPAASDIINGPYVLLYPAQSLHRSRVVGDSKLSMGNCPPKWGPQLLHD